MKVADLLIRLSKIGDPNAELQMRLAFEIQRENGHTLVLEDRDIHGVYECPKTGKVFLAVDLREKD